MSRQRRIPTPAWQNEGVLSGGMTGHKARVLAVVGIVGLVALAVAVVGAGFLIDYVNDQRRPGSTAIAVNDHKYSVSDYTERAKLYVEQSGGNAGATTVIGNVSTDIIEEALLLEFAAEEGVEARDDEVKAEIAELLGITADDANFDARLQEELATIDLSEAEYRDMARANVLREKMIAKFQEDLPAGSESVHYRLIRVQDQEAADELRTQIENGAAFEDLAREHSLDTSTKDLGGDAGWAPRGYLADAQEDILFSLDPNEMATYPTASGVFLYQVIEVAEDRPIDEDKKEALANQNYSEWLSEKQETADIENDLDLNSTDSDFDKIRYVIDHAGLSTQ